MRDFMGTNGISMGSRWFKPPFKSWTKVSFCQCWKGWCYWFYPFGVNGLIRQWKPTPPSVSSYQFGMSFPIAIHFFKEVETCWNHQPETGQLQRAFHLSQMAEADGWVFVSSRSNIADTPKIDPDPFDMLGKLQSEADFQLKIELFDGDLWVTQVL